MADVPCSVEEEVRARGDVHRPRREVKLEKGGDWERVVHATLDAGFLRTCHTRLHLAVLCPDAISCISEGRRKQMPTLLRTLQGWLRPMEAAEIENGRLVAAVQVSQIPPL
jgi:hypothetical protein